MSLLIVTFTSAFCSMSFSMIMALVMTEFTGEEVFTQCLTVGPYLLGLGLGSVYGDRVKEELGVKRLWFLEWLSVIFLPVIPLLQIIGVFVFMNLSPMNVTLDSRIALQVLLGYTAVLSFFAGALGGAQLPIILRQEKKFSEELILAVNYLGPLAAGIFIVTMAGNAVSMALQIFTVGLFQLAGVAALMIALPNRQRQLSLLFLPMIILIGASHVYPEAELLTVKSSYLRTRSSFPEILFPKNLVRVIKRYGDFERVRTRYQTIDLLIEPPEPNYGIPGNANVFLNRKPQFDLFSSDIYHQTMVYGAFNLLKKIPETVLILGAGDGLLLKELKSHPEIRKITMVELDEGMLEWSRTNPVISTLNRGVLSALPANAEIIIGDAISFLRKTPTQKYDLILIDFPFPNGHELAKLYSFEFYSMVRKVLAPGGLVMLDLPLYIDESKVLAQESRVIIKTLKAAGFGNPLLLGPMASFIAVTADERKLRFDYSRFPDHLSIATYTNFISPFRENEIPPEDWKAVPVNTMFRPRGL